MTIIQAYDLGKMPITTEYVTLVEAIRAYLVGMMGELPVTVSYRLEKNILQRDLDSTLAVLGDAPAYYLNTHYRDHDLPSADLITLDDETHLEKNKLCLSDNNVIVIYPTYNIAYVGFTHCLSKGFDHQHFILGKSLEDIEHFTADVKVRQREFNITHTLILRDGRYDLTEEYLKHDELINYDEVFLEPTLKEGILRSIQQFFQDDGVFYKKHNIAYRRGILLYGKPGNGKTTLVKALTKQVKAPVIYWQVTENTTSDSISTVFDHVGDKAPAILVIEDIDSLPISSRSMFLNTLDGSVVREGIFIIGTTNYPEKVDEGLKNRPGRFDRTYEIGLPAPQFRRAFLVHRGIQDLITPEELTQLVTATEGLPMASLNEVYVAIALNLHYKGVADIATVVSELQESQYKQKNQRWEKSGDNIGFN